MGRAIVCTAFGPVERLEWRDVGRSDLLPGHVRVAVRAGSVGYMDNLMVRGMYQLRPELPYTPGACGAGVVSEAAADVTAARVGDRVSFLNYFGAFAEEIVTHQATLAHLPGHMDFDQGAAYRLTYSPAYFALVLRGQLRQGDTLVVTGASGGVGTAAVQLGTRLGATVIATVSTPEKAQIALANGARHAIVYGATPLRHAIRELTGGRGADVALDVVGGDVFAELTHCIAPFGRILVMGFTSGDIPSLRTNLMLLKNAAVMGVFFGGWGIGKNHEEVRKLNSDVMALAADDGGLRVNIGQRMPMRDAAAALAAVARREMIGKISLYNG